MGQYGIEGGILAPDGFFGFGEFAAQAADVVECSVAVPLLQHMIQHNEVMAHIVPVGAAEFEFAAEGVVIALLKGELMLGGEFGFAHEA